MTERRVLIIEPEDTLLKIFQEYFSQLGGGYLIQQVHTVSAALDLVHQNSIEVAVLDHQGPGRLDCIEFLRVLRDHKCYTQVIVIADEQFKPLMLPVLSLGATNFLLKPPDASLCELVFHMLQPQQGFIGRVVSMKLEDVIQMFCYRKESTLLWVFHERAKGMIYVHDGGIIHAECDSLSGVEAFYEILGWEGGEFLSQVALSVPERTLFMDWQSLLMEGMRQKDEIRHALGPISEIPGSAAKGNNSRPGAMESVQESTGPAKRVMIVDDSRFIRKIVQEILQSDPGVIVAGYATNGQEALAKIDELKPDLILLDWDMPVMKGSTTLMHIMIRSPCPVVILSGFVGGVGANPFDLLCLGGVDFLRKPQNNWRMDGRADDLVRRIKEASLIKFERIRRVKIPPAIQKEVSEEAKGNPSNFLTIVWASTGGSTDLIRTIPLLPEDLPTCLVVLHDMQQEAIGAFIDYLQRRSRIRVRPLVSGLSLLDGTCYIHPSTVPVELMKNGNQFVLKVVPELRGIPVLDHFMVSASKSLGGNLVSVMLSGGSDNGIEGLRAVKQVQGITVVQDPMSSMDPRMAEAVLQEGLADYSCPADSLVETLTNIIRLAVTS
ncbi:chemotaxis protein CheB [Desulfomonile tiedjei]|uniref:protein-glutamate methylesterase n=1 Tax=Desulfomonile tiedjei (strain ATCC 49306 / DSM 6799 / DCB-1) TaxID=706587 RepID=I4CCZ7_DESTA|nr:chemotaxis protein CheB [Desulfomonile tiedjei]AFM27438.1 chemotaxis response regulator containing a CheY-like receiver domain and a methylesterase domain [Desulfomonile tiedjei DSM 6799]